MIVFPFADTALPCPYSPARQVFSFFSLSRDLKCGGGQVLFLPCMRVSPLPFSPLPPFVTVRWRDRPHFSPSDSSLSVLALGFLERTSCPVSGLSFQIRLPRVSFSHINRLRHRSRPFPYPPFPGAGSFCCRSILFLSLTLQQRPE